MFVSPRIPRPLIPEPTGFSDPVKRKAARAERAWEATQNLSAGAAASLGAAAVVGAVVVAPIAPFFLAFAGVANLFKTRAKWLKDDPPRADYEVAHKLTHPQINVVPLADSESGFDWLVAARWIALVETGAHYVDATVASLEKAMGAEFDVDRSDVSVERIAGRRRAEASYYAHLAHPVLQSIGMATENLVAALEPIQLSSAEYSIEPGRLVNIVGSSVLGCVLASGIDPVLLDTTLDGDELSALDLRETFSTAGRSAFELGRSLETWASSTGSTRRARPRRLPGRLASDM